MLIANKPKTAIYTLVAVLLIAAVAVGCTFTGAKNSDSAPSDEWFLDEARPAAEAYATENNLNIEKSTGIVIRYASGSEADAVFTETDGVRSVSVAFTLREDGQWTILPAGGINLLDPERQVEISIDASVDAPQTAIDYAVDYAQTQLDFYTEEVGYEITEAKITGLTQIDLPILGADTTIGLWLLEYRFLAADPDKVMIVGGMQMDGDYITEWGSTGQPYLLLNRTADTTYELICVTNTLTMQEEYATPEMLKRYGDMYTAAAMELASAAGIAFHPATQTDEGERLRLATVVGFSHMPLDELPQEVLDSLTMVNEGDFNGFYPSEWGYCRTYTALGLEIKTTAPSAAYLDMLAERDRDNRELYPTEADFWSYIEGEAGREWIVHVLITDDKYATIDGLKVGMTIEEAENLGYALSAGTNNVGTVSVELSVVVENDAVVQMGTWWTMGRYIGKFFEL